VVSPQQEEWLWILDFVSQQQANGLHALFAPVHVVPQKEVVGVRWEASILEDAQQVIELTVNVAWRAQLDWVKQSQRQKWDLPQIFRGVSSSRSEGCWRKISLAAMHRFVTSFSAMATWVLGSWFLAEINHFDWRLYIQAILRMKQ
jgi:hypothetical protein